MSKEIDWIQGDKFISLMSENIVFCKTENVNHFFQNCRKDLPFILITHNGDGSITDNPRKVNTLEAHHHADVRLMPENLYRWYGCMVEYESEKIISIPIGVENNKLFLSKKDIIEKMNETESAKRSDRLLYINFKISNNYAERISAYNSVKDKHFCTFSEKMFTEQQLNPPSEPFPPVYKEPYEKFANEVKAHKFVLCPVGNGLESHRLWETLYLGSFPITRRNINYSFYEDKLPILMVDDWSDITEEFLQEKYLDMQSKMLDGYYNLDMLNFRYWSNLILEDVTSMREKFKI